jgi:hypothetical protein
MGIDSHQVPQNSFGSVQKTQRRHIGSSNAHPLLLSDEGQRHVKILPGQKRAAKSMTRQIILRLNQRLPDLVIQADRDKQSHAGSLLDRLIFRFHIAGVNLVLLEKQIDPDKS